MNIFCWNFAHVQLNNVYKRVSGIFTLLDLNLLRKIFKKPSFGECEEPGDGKSLFEVAGTNGFYQFFKKNFKKT